MQFPITEVLTAGAAIAAGLIYFRYRKDEEAARALEFQRDAESERTDSVMISRYIALWHDCQGLREKIARVKANKKRSTDLEALLISKTTAMLILETALIAADIDLAGLFDEQVA